MVEQEHTQEAPAAQGARVGAEVGAQVGAVVGTAVDELGQRAGEAAAVLADTYGTVREKVAAAEPGALVRQWAGAVEGVVESVVEQGRDRASAVRATPVPAPRRTVSWSVGAAVAGALGGVAVALLVRRLLGSDAPGAQEPDQLRAVVDTGTGAPAAPTPVPDPPVAPAPVPGVAPVPPGPQGTEGL